MEWPLIAARKLAGYKSATIPKAYLIRHRLRHMEQTYAEGSGVGR